MREYVKDPRELAEIYSKLTGLNLPDLTVQRLVYESPLIDQCTFTGALKLKGFLSIEEWREMSDLISGLILVFLRSHEGKEIARDQIEILHRFIFPNKYKIHDDRVKELARMYRNTSLARGWALRKLMKELSDIVVPARANAKNILAGAVRISTETHAKEHFLYQEAMRHWTRAATLQLLAIRIYLARAQVATSAEGKESTLDERMLKRDLMKVRKWEEGDPEHMLIKMFLKAKDPQGNLPIEFLIPTRLFSESTWFFPPVLNEGEQNEK